MALSTEGISKCFAVCRKHLPLFEREKEKRKVARDLPTISKSQLGGQ